VVGGLLMPQASNTSGGFGHNTDMENCILFLAGQAGMNLNASDRLTPIKGKPHHSGIPGKGCSS
jgi:hypothetical protein